MTLEFLYWFFVLLLALGWGYGLTPQGTIYWGRGGWIITFALFVLIGLRAFGPILQR